MCKVTANCAVAQQTGGTENKGPEMDGPNEARSFQDTQVRCRQCAVVILPCCCCCCCFSLVYNTRTTSVIFSLLCFESSSRDVCLQLSWSKSGVISRVVITRARQTGPAITAGCLCSRMTLWSCPGHIYSTRSALAVLTWLVCLPSISRRPVFTDHSLSADLLYSVSKRSRVLSAV